MDTPEYLPPSELGTKEYWETFYARSLSNLNPESKNEKTTQPTNDDDEDHENDSDEDEDDDESDDEDPGTSWFKEHNAPQKVVELLTSDDFPLSPTATQSQSQSQSQTQEQPSILDLGTGNGSMLALLRRGGFEGKMVGVDYSRGSVELARALHPPPGSASGSAQGIRFEEWDILNAEPGDWFPSDTNGFDIVLDKGTFDAVSLSDESDDGVKRVCERYPRIAAGLVRKGGFLVVTSCNWTETELKRWFLPSAPDAGAVLEVWGRVEYPVFRFGGMEGQGVCTVCFQRVD